LKLAADRATLRDTRSAGAMIRPATIHMMLNHLHPKEGEQEFRYRDAA
jgi:hypothetical protein